MIWFAWRQFRAQALTAVVVLSLFLAALALTWRRVTDPARETGFTGCQAECDEAAKAFLDALFTPTSVLYLFSTGIVFVLPALIGVAWGAPLVARELEAGTYRLVLSQSVSRRRWLLVKLSLGGGIAAVTMGLISLVLTVWAAPIDQALGSRITPQLFMARGIVPIASTALAFVVGVIVGLLLRRTLAAMAVTALTVVLLQGAIAFLLPSVLLKPATSITALDLGGYFKFSMNSDNEVQVSSEVEIPDTWIRSTTAITPDGAEFKGKGDAHCTKSRSRDVAGLDTACRQWLEAQNLRQKITYYPESTFWTLQWREFGTLVLFTLGLCWYCLWLMRR